MLNRSQFNTSKFNSFYFEIEFPVVGQVVVGGNFRKRRKGRITYEEVFFWAIGSKVFNKVVYYVITGTRTILKDLSFYFSGQKSLKYKQELIGIGSRVLEDINNFIGIGSCLTNEIAESSCIGIKSKDFETTQELIGSFITTIKELDNLLCGSKVFDYTIENGLLGSKQIDKTENIDVKGKKDFRKIFNVIFFDEY